MTLEEAHKMLDEEYAKNETVTFGFRSGKVPSSVRVALSLIRVSEEAQREADFFSFSAKRKGAEE